MMTSIVVGCLLLGFCVVVFGAILFSEWRNKRNKMVEVLDDMAEKVVSSPSNVNVQKDDPELYILDTQVDFAMWVAGAVLDTTPAWEICPITEGYEELANFFRTRKMESLIIPRSQFMQEWFEGIEKTQSGYMEEEGERREFIQYGCSVSKFTEIVAAIRMTARREVPSAVYSIKNWRGDSYRVGVNRGLVTFIIRDNDFTS
ncbi:hypothetical protein HYV70_04215 [Candidatus Uhrbacteria bacterium]|nr:hypothetical protein [Candidatus Uhrbacteria bacterium]